MPPLSPGNHGSRRVAKRPAAAIAKQPAAAIAKRPPVAIAKQPAAAIPEGPAAAMVRVSDGLVSMLYPQAMASGGCSNGEGQQCPNVGFIRAVYLNKNPGAWPARFLCLRHYRMVSLHWSEPGVIRKPHQQGLMVQEMLYPQQAAQSCTVLRLVTSSNPLETSPGMHSATLIEYPEMDGFVPLHIVCAILDALKQPWHLNLNPKPVLFCVWWPEALYKAKIKKNANEESVIIHKGIRGFVLQPDQGFYPGCVRLFEEMTASEDTVVVAR